MDYLKEYIEIINTTTDLLVNNKEWEERYRNYIEEILKKEDYVKSFKKQINVKDPLHIYSSISMIKNSSRNKVKLDIRYHGQSVANVTVNTNGKNIFEIKDKTNRDFECNSNSIEELNNFFINSPARSINSPVKKAEHRCESILLKEFSRGSSEDKPFLGIQPVKLAKCWFQMPTPLGGSNAKLDDVKYSKQYGGGIDILCRRKRGYKTRLCIMELKDESSSSEPPEKAIKQAIAYATFLQQLLRNENSNASQWWNFFGFMGSVPDSLILNAVVVMPKGNYNDKSFAKLKIPIGQSDFIELHYLYFDMNFDSNQIMKPDTSL